MSERHAVAALPRAETPKFRIEDGKYTLGVPCPACQRDTLDCFPGAWPKCWNCGVTVLLYGKTPKAKCVSPNGRVDGHMAYVRAAKGSRRGLVCAFCGRAS